MKQCHSTPKGVAGTQVSSATLITLRPVDQLGQPKIGAWLSMRWHTNIMHPLRTRWPVTVYRSSGRANSLHFAMTGRGCSVRPHASCCVNRCGTTVVLSAGASAIDLSQPTSILQALTVLAAIVTVHECGHFFAARLQGIHVSKFSIGFGPSLFTYQVRWFAAWRLEVPCNAR